MPVVRIGVDETIAALEAMRPRMAADVLEPAVAMGARAAVAMARMNAPRQSGRYAASIVMIGPRDASDDERLPGPDAPTTTRVQAVVGSSMFYATFLEYGAAPSSKAPLGNPRGLPARNIVGNAVEQTRQVVEDGLAFYMERLLQELGF